MICIPEYGRHKAIKCGLQSLAAIEGSIKRVFAKTASEHVRACVRECVQRAARIELLAGILLPFPLRRSLFSRLFLFYSARERVRVSFLISYIRASTRTEGKNWFASAGRRKTRRGHTIGFAKTMGLGIIMIGHETPGVTCVIVNYQFPLRSLRDK